MNDLIVRDARDGDREIIRRVTLSAYEQYAAVMQTHWEGYRHNILTTLGDVKPAEQIVAEQHGAIVGTVLLYPAGTLAWPELRLLAVAPAARGQGVGAALMRECVRRARQSGAAALTLHTHEIMVVAMRMYERMGFVRAPDLDFHPAKDVTIKGYRLNLTEGA